MASEQTAVLHSQERPVYINKGSALTQNLIFSAALAGAGAYGLLALQHTLRTGSQWVDATAPNGYSLYQFAYGVIGSVIQNFKIDKAMADQTRKIRTSSSKMVCSDFLFINRPKFDEY